MSMGLSSSDIECLLELQLVKGIFKKELHTRRMSSADLQVWAAVSAAHRRTFPAWCSKVTKVNMNLIKHEIVVEEERRIASSMSAFPPA
jgi:hypothetical protein